MLGSRVFQSPDDDCARRPDLSLGKTEAASLRLTSRRNKNAGLVGPANLISCSLRGATWFWGSPQICSVYLIQDLTRECHRYMTSARFSSSFSKTGKEQPDISTRPTASIAACGETPYPRPIRNTCSNSAAPRESTRPPCSKSFRNAVNSVLENRSFMAVSLPPVYRLHVLDS